MKVWILYVRYLILKQFIDYWLNRQRFKITRRVPMWQSQLVAIRKSLRCVITTGLVIMAIYISRKTSHPLLLNMTVSRVSRFLYRVDARHQLLRSRFTTRCYIKKAYIGKDNSSYYALRCWRHRLKRLKAINCEMEHILTNESVRDIFYL